MSERELKDLILHCWVHSGYQNCGYKQMTTEQKQLYDSILKENEQELDAELYEMIGDDNG